ncbi:O-antigen ligase family protein, partial [Patescibacteria group bacterium]
QTRIAGITDPADSASFRLISWKNTWEIAKDNLLFGVGFNAFKFAQEEHGFLTPDSARKYSATGSDSSLLLVLATTGILGLSVFLFGMFYPVFAKRSLFLLIVTMSLFLESQFINSLFFPQILFLYLNMLILV